MLKVFGCFGVVHFQNALKMLPRENTDLSWVPEYLSNFHSLLSLVIIDSSISRIFSPEVLYIYFYHFIFLWQNICNSSLKQIFTFAEYSKLKKYEGNPGSEWKQKSWPAYTSIHQNAIINAHFFLYPTTSSPFIAFHSLVPKWSWLVTFTLLTLCFHC